jgi:hypothetical protein
MFFNIVIPNNFIPINDWGTSLRELEANQIIANFLSQYITATSEKSTSFDGSIRGKIGFCGTNRCGWGNGNSVLIISCLNFTGSFLSNKAKTTASSVKRNTYIVCHENEEAVVKTTNKPPVVEEGDVVVAEVDVVLVAEDESVVVKAYDIIVEAGIVFVAEEGFHYAEADSVVVFLDFVCCLRQLYNCSRSR